MTKEEEDNLVRRVKNSDGEAFTALYDDTYGLALATTRRVLRYRPDDAEDMVQNTMLKAFINIDKYDGRCRFKTWICRIAVNESLSLLRKASVNGTLTAASLQDSEHPEDTWPSLAVRGGQHYVDACMELDVLAERIGPKNFAVLEAVHVLGFTHVELAAAQGGTQMSHRMSCYRAMRKARGH